MSSSFDQVFPTVAAPGSTGSFLRRLSPCLPLSSYVISMSLSLPFPLILHFPSVALGFSVPRDSANGLSLFLSLRSTLPTLYIPCSSYPERQESAVLPPLPQASELPLHPSLLSQVARVFRSFASLESLSLSLEVSLSLSPTFPYHHHLFLALTLVILSSNYL